MKTLLASICAVALSAPMAPAQDWSGAYVVLGQPKVSGDLTEYFDGNPSGVTAQLEGDFTTIGVGANWQRQNFVFGTELGFSTGDVSLSPFASANHLEDVLELRGRVGLATGRFLWFASLGYARSTHEFHSDASGKADGVSYGIGMDILVTDSFFFGAEVLQRNLKVDEGAYTDNPLFSYDHKMQTVGLRLGMKF